MIRVSRFYIKNLCVKYENGLPFKVEELDRFYYKNEKSFVACDNSTGKCKIERFKNLSSMFDFFSSGKTIEEILKEDRKKSKELDVKPKLSFTKKSK